MGVAEKGEPNLKANPVLISVEKREPAESGLGLVLVEGRNRSRGFSETILCKERSCHYQYRRDLVAGHGYEESGRICLGGAAKGGSKSNGPYDIRSHAIRWRAGPDRPGVSTGRRGHEAADDEISRIGGEGDARLQRRVSGQMFNDSCLRLRS